MSSSFGLETIEKQIARLASGDSAVLLTWFDSYYNYLMVVGLRYLSNRASVEDLIQDIFADIWDKRHSLDAKNIKFYLRGAMVNKCLARIRKEKRISLPQEQVEPKDKAEDGQNYLEHKELVDTVNKLISQLPEKCQKVFTLSRYEYKSHKEISEIMNISTKTIENHMTKALKTIRTGLKELGFIPMILLIISIVN